MERSAFRKWLLGWSVIFSTPILLAVPAGFGHVDDLLLFCGALALVPAGIVGFAVLWPRRLRTWGEGRRLLDRAAWFAFVTPFLIPPAFLFVHDRTRRAMLSSFVVRAGPVVEAIERHVEENGEPPVSLGGLVPAYLAAPPTTGMSAYPHYEYSRSRDGDWRLSVPCSPGFFAFDTLRYAPGAESPGSATRYGDWLLVHD